MKVWLEDKFAADAKIPWPRPVPSTSPNSAMAPVM